MKTFRQAPYYDDYKETSKFHKVLFRPSMALQAREANQVQTIIQNQIKRFGDHVFKNGTKVLDGQLTFDTTVKYLRVNSESNLSAFVGETITGSESGVRARVVAYVDTDNSKDATPLLIVSLLSGGNDAEQEFQPGEQVAAYDDLKAQILKDADGISAVGGSSIAHIERGVYYVNGYFVLVDEQTIVLDQYSSYPSATVGLAIEEKFVTENEDATLYDNAIDSYNYAAPGAHRYWIDLILEKHVNGSVLNDDFLILGKIERGNVVKIIETTEYNELGDTLAMRTYEESGDYTVEPFKISLWEHRSNARGEWVAGESYNRGDVVVANGDSYVAMSSGISLSQEAPSESGAESAAGSATGISWNKVENPVFNDGIYPASGPIKALNIINTGDSFGAAPTITISSTHGDGAEAIATVADGKINSVELTNAGTGYTCDPITVDITPNISGAQIEAVAQYGDESKFVADISPGKAYVRGYRINKVGSTYVEIPKAREFVQVDDNVFTVSYGNYIVVKNMKGMPPVMDMGYVYLGTEKDVNKYLASARIRAVTKHPENQDFIRLYLTNIVVTKSGDNLYNSISGATMIYDEKGFSADIVQEKGYTSIYGTGEESFFRLPHHYVRSVSGEDGKMDMKCSVLYTITTQIDGKFAAPNNMQFAPKNEGHFLERVNGVWKVGEGAINSSLTEYTSDEGADALIATMIISDNNIANLRKTKTEKEFKRTISAETDKNHIEGPKVLVKEGRIMLNLVDVTSIEKVLIDGKDVTSQYDLFTGQDDAFYGESYVQLKKSYANPVVDGAWQEIVVEGTYYEHSEAGYFYTADSYMSDRGDGSFDNVDIPDYNGIPLRDVIDFRPDVLNCTDTIDGEVHPKCNNVIPLTDTSIQMDYSYYLGRKDRIVLTKDGDFVDVMGIPAIDPKLPEIPENSMPVFNLTILPYTEKVNADNIVVEIIDNKRYTMRDIGRLESRITNLEEYTTLSLLEQQTASMAITNADGTTRFANGFVVDNFKGSVLASETDEDYNCAMDMERGICRPAYTTESVDLIVKTKSSKDNTPKLKRYGKVLTLPLNETTPHVLLCAQQLASKTESVNPYAVATFYGTVKVNPATDDWYETEYKPNVVVNVEGNYSQVKNSGVEGTVWNNWQTTWTGATAEVGTSRNVNVTRDDWNDGWGSYTENTITTTTKTYAQTVGQTRTGLKTTVSSRIDYQEVGDKLISTSTIPYMRSRYLLVKAKGLKPFTKFTPKFDNVDVSYWCTPASEIKFTSVNGTDFDSTTMSAENSDQKARWILGTKNSYWAEATEKTCLDVGDVISGDGTDNKPVTAVVVGQSIDPSDSAGVKTLYVVNIHRSTTDGSSGKEIGDAASDGIAYDSKGKPSAQQSGVTFKTGSTFTGSISGAKGKVWDGTGYTPDLNRSHYFDDLISNHAGELYFLFWIPDKSKLNYAQLKDPAAQGAFTFECGDKTLEVVDVADAEDPKAGTIYSATGILNTRQKTINAVRNAQVVTSAVSESKTATNTWSTQNITTKSKSVNLDPLSETFLVKQKGGAFLSKVDVFFAAKDESLPVTLQIRTVENGYPSTQVLAFAEVVKNPSEINLSTNYVKYVNDYGKDVIYPTFDTPTTFEFESPVYVEQDTEYAIVLLSNSNKYRVWIAQVGDTVPGSTELISKQPFNGVLFKSQNGSTWTAEQNQDLKFNLWRANFVTGQEVGETFVQPSLGKEFLEENPFETFESNRFVRVWHPHHGFNIGDNVSFEYYNPNDTDDANNTADYLLGAVSIDGGSNNVSSSVGGSNNSIRNVTFSNYNDLSKIGVGADLYNKDGERLGYFTKIGGKNEASELCVYDDKLGTQNNLVGCYVMESLNGIQMSKILFMDNDSDAAPVIRQHKIISASTAYLKEVDENGNIVDKKENGKNVAVEPTMDIGENWFLIALDESSVSDEEASKIRAGFGGGKYIQSEKAIKYDILQPCVNYQNFDETAINFSSTVYIDSKFAATNTRARNIDIAINDNNALMIPCRVANSSVAPDVDASDRQQNFELRAVLSSSNPALSPVIDSERVSAIFIHNLLDNPDGNEANALASYITKEVKLNATSTQLKIMFAYNLPSNGDSATDIKVYVKASENGQALEGIDWQFVEPSQILKSVPIGVDEKFYDVSYTFGDDSRGFSSFALRIDFVGNNSCAVPKIQQLRVIASE